MMSITVFVIKDLQNRIQLRKTYLESLHNQDCFKKYGSYSDWSLSGDFIDDPELREFYFEIEKMMPEFVHRQDAKI